MNGQSDNAAWSDTILKWLPVCSAAEGRAEEIICLRGLADFIEQAPSDVVSLLGSMSNRTEIETLLELGATETVAARLIQASPFGYLVSQAYDGPACCTVSLAGSSLEVHFSCSSASLVRIGATLKAIATTMKPRDVALVHDNPMPN
ncbi:MAG: hypothetical protein P1U62_13180 [Alteraurantiacibacter sp. bin_em_oilr2.035]|nr:hypothetical protein [Alteraurantiacibacter sp. bin_em_oilr2.035]